MKIILAGMMLILGLMAFHNAFADANQTNNSIRVGNENAAEVDQNLRNFLIGEHMRHQANNNISSFIAMQQKEHKELYKLYDVMNLTSYEKYLTNKPSLATTMLGKELQQKSWYDIETASQKMKMMKLLHEYKQTGSYRDFAYQ